MCLFATSCYTFSYRPLETHWNENDIFCVLTCSRSIFLMMEAMYVFIQIAVNKEQKSNAVFKKKKTFLWPRKYTMGQQVFSILMHPPIDD